MPIVVDKDRKMEEIGSAALQVFRQKGFHGTRMVDIAVAADVGKGTLYEYFDDKADILRLEFERYFDAFRNGAVEATAGLESPAERLLALIDFAFEHVAEWESHCAVFVDYFSAGEGGKDSSFSLAAIYENMHELLEQLIEDGKAAGELREEIDPVATAELFLSIFDGIVLHGVFTERHCETDSLRAMVRPVVEQVLLNPPQPDKTQINE